MSTSTESWLARQLKDPAVRRRLEREMKKLEEDNLLDGLFEPVEMIDTTPTEPAELMTDEFATEVFDEQVCLRKAGE